MSIIPASAPDGVGDAFAPDGAAAEDAPAAAESRLADAVGDSGADPGADPGVDPGAGPGPGSGAGPGTEPGTGPSAGVDGGDLRVNAPGPYDEACRQSAPSSEHQGAAGAAISVSVAPAAQQQRLEVAAAAVLVHAAGCKNPTCPVPHCNKMRKIHTHFLECRRVSYGGAPWASRATLRHTRHFLPTVLHACATLPYRYRGCSLADCAICKKLKPLTFIHAKHCVSAPGEQCVIPYCARAKRELHLLMQRRGGSLAAADDTRGPGVPSSTGAGGAATALLSGGGGSASTAGMLSTAPAALESMNTQAQAHYLLVLAHVMKCPRLP